LKKNAILQNVINAIKNLDFELLKNILKDEYSYMDVPKDTFLNRLEQEFKNYQENGLNHYEQIITGSCGRCNLGCNAYSFYKENFPSLNLFFEIKNNEVKDIKLCGNLEGAIENDCGTIYFDFYEEDKVSFKPSSAYYLIVQKAEIAIKEFKTLKQNNFITIEDLASWRDKFHQLILTLGINNPLNSKKYKAFIEIDKVSFDACRLLEYYDENEYAIKAMEEYKQIDDNNEKDIEEWVSKYRKHYLVTYSHKFDNWKTTGLMILKTNPELIVDCSSCLDAFKFAEVYADLKAKNN